MNFGVFGFLIFWALAMFQHYGAAADSLAANGPLLSGSATLAEPAGPPGIYTTMRSTNLSVWNALATVTNVLGSVHFADVSTNLAEFTFYSANLQELPASGEIQP